MNPQRHAGWNRVAVASLATLTLTLLGTGITMHVLGRDSVMEMPLWQESLQRWTTVAHGVVTWLFCIMVGRWIWPHASQVWHRRARNWIWIMGIATACVGIILSLAGLGLLYGPAAWHDALSLAHWWMGLAWPALCGMHAGHRRLRRGQHRG